MVAPIAVRRVAVAVKNPGTVSNQDCFLSGFSAFFSALSAVFSGFAFSGFAIISPLGDSCLHDARRPASMGRIQCIDGDLYHVRVGPGLAATSDS